MTAASDRFHRTGGRGGPPDVNGHPARPCLWRALVWMLVAGVTVAACGTGGGSSSAPPADPEPTATADTAAAFPLTMEHKYGSTEIPDVPERVVSVGLTDQDPILALGVAPVGVLDWFGDQPNAVWPWARDELGDADPEIIGVEGELNYELIAGLRPDVIIGVYSGLTEDEYDTLSQIAPTVAQPAEYADYAVPWQEQTRVIARALGRAEKAEQLITEVEGLFERAREAHPQFQGKTALVATPADAGVYGTWGPTEPSGRFLTSLGFQLPPEIVELVGDGVQADFSREQFELIDADVLIWLLNSPDEREALANDPLYQQLRVASQGRDIFLEYEPFGAAIFFSSPLSLPFLLEELVPQIAAAAGGDPATEVSPGS
ncbi:MAG: iron-siderophore ABC transporter substrate-binding protein [Egibacteraceae bacterium]